MDCEKDNANRMNQGEETGEDPGPGEAADMESLKQILAAEQERANANLAGWQRAQADFANYRRRTDHEKKESSRFANQALILDLLPVLDDLERALDAIPCELAEHSWTDGVRLIERKLRATLQSRGLEPIAACGEPFDPHLHEAVMQSSGKEGIVIEEIQKGYRLHDRVIRPSQVVVGNGEEDNQQGGEV